MSWQTNGFSRECFEHKELTIDGKCRKSLVFQICQKKNNRTSPLKKKLSDRLEFFLLRLIKTKVSRYDELGFKIKGLKVLKIFERPKKAQISRFIGKKTHRNTFGTQLKVSM